MRNRRPDAILCSDMHLREDVPICFVGDWELEQFTALAFIKNLQEEYKCPVYHAGDLFDHWKPSPYLLSRAIELLPDMFISVYGQHDLPQHNLKLSYKCGMNTLIQAGKVSVLRDGYWGWEPKGGKGIIMKGREILLWHHMTYLTKPFPGASGGMAEGLLRKYPQYDLIVTGDNHQSFSVEYKGRLLVNPGNMTRQTVDQIDFQPRVALWYADTNTIKWVNLPKQEDVISREHLEIKEARDKRIDAFISTLTNNWKANLSFEDNLEVFKNKNKIDNDIMDIIYKSLNT